MFKRRITKTTIGFFFVSLVILIISVGFYQNYMLTYYSADKLKIAALHEASHAVIAEYFYPNTVQYTEIDPVPPAFYTAVLYLCRSFGIPNNWDMIVSGKTHTHFKENLATDKDYYIKRIMFCRAGFVGSRLALDAKEYMAWVKYGIRGNDSDQYEIYKALLEVYKAMGYVSKDFKLGTALETDELYRKSGDKTEKLNDDLRKEVDSLIESHKAEIIAVSKALLEKKKLTGTEVRAIIKEQQYKPYE